MSCHSKYRCRRLNTMEARHLQLRFLGPVRCITTSHCTGPLNCLRGIARHGIHACEICGWFTGRLSADVDLCYNCGFNAICMECTYLVHGIGRRCLLCSPIPRHFPLHHISMLTLLYHASDALDVLTRSGIFHPRKPRDAFLAWGRVARARIMSRVSQEDI